jgi:hypothetical protein
MDISQPFASTNLKGANMRLVLACLFLSSCGFPDPRDPQLSGD